MGGSSPLIMAGELNCGTWLAASGSGPGLWDGTESRWMGAGDGWSGHRMVWALPAGELGRPDVVSAGTTAAG